MTEEVEEIDQWFSGSDALLEDLSLIPNTHVRYVL